jgi:hypothetical protein
MKANQDYQQLCNLLVKRYAKQMGIHKVPKVYITQKEFNKADICDGTKLGEGNLKASGYYGLYCNECNIIYSNPRLCTTMPILTKNIVHELIHAKWFETMNHGKRYDRRIELIIEGKRYD